MRLGAPRPKQAQNHPLRLQLQLHQHQHQPQAQPQPSRHRRQTATWPRPRQSRPWPARLTKPLLLTWLQLKLHRGARHGVGRRVQARGVAASRARRWQARRLNLPRSESLRRCHKLMTQLTWSLAGRRPRPSQRTLPSRWRLSSRRQSRNRREYRQSEHHHAFFDSAQGRLHPCLQLQLQPLGAECLRPTSLQEWLCQTPSQLFHRKHQLQLQMKLQRPQPAIVLLPPPPPQGSCQA
mmetsp:Transcript_3971/g.16574  ORF Transcript_3971/g.16574 Transcript_3971/m.16574 type:complete len:237 (-) Transcript_3971:211-921(-)